MARNTSHTTEKENQIIEAVSNGIPLAQAVKKVGMGLTTWYDWTYKDQALAERFARARISGHEIIATQTLEIADESPPLTERGGIDPGYVSWQKNRIWTRMQLLSKWDPKRYGDKLTVAGDQDSPLKIEKIERVIVDQATQKKEN